MVIPRKLHRPLYQRLHLTIISTSQLITCKGILITACEKDSGAHLDESGIVRVDDVDIDLFSLELLLT